MTMGKKTKSNNKNTGQSSTAPASHNLTRVKAELHDSVDKLLRLTTQPVHASTAKEFDLYCNIYDLVDVINRLEAKVHGSSKHVAQGTHGVPSDRNSVQVVAEFTDWLRAHGALFDNVSIAEFAGYDLGLRADCSVVETGLLICVPRKLMMTLEDAQQSALKPIIEGDAILQNMNNVALALYLLLEKHSDDSFWKPYLKILPKQYSTVLYFKREEIEELAGSPTQRSALLQIRNICRQYAYFFKVLQTSNSPVCQMMRNCFTFKEYCWAASTVMTRQNTIPSIDQSRLINALIPLWDMCNHINGTITTNFNPLLDRSECLALTNMKAGEQIFIFYGQRTNAELFIHNGFVYEDNEHDGYGLSLGISSSDPLQSQRCAILSKLDISSSMTFFLNYTEPLNENLLAFLRIFNMNEGQLNHWLSSDKVEDLRCLDCALDTALEKKTWTFLHMRVKLLLSAYKTTLEEDKHMLLDNTQLSENCKLAIRMRMCEKRILQGVLLQVDQYVNQ